MSILQAQLLQKKNIETIEFDVNTGIFYRKNRTLQGTFICSKNKLILNCPSKITFTTSDWNLFRKNSLIIRLPDGESLCPHLYVRIPKIVHLFQTNDVFDYFEYMVLLSSFKYIMPTKIFFWCRHQPTGKYWDDAIKYIDIKHWDSEISDLEILHKYGGIRLMLDKIVVKNFDDLLDYDSVSVKHTNYTLMSKAKHPVWVGCTRNDVRTIKVLEKTQLKTYLCNREDVTQDIWPRIDKTHYLHQTLSTFKDIHIHHPILYKKLSSWKLNLPNLEHHTHTNEDCEFFLSECFNGFVYNCYNTVIPGAYKSDIWRLCVLYKFGGIYADTHLECVNPTLLQQLINTFDGIFVVDHPISESAIYNAFMYIKEPNNNIIKSILDSVCDNVKKKIYTDNPLGITGPIAHGNCISTYIDYSIDEEEYWLNGKKYVFLHHIQHPNADYSIQYKNENVIICRYPEYRNDMYTINKTRLHYSQAWSKRIVFNQLS